MNQGKLGKIKAIGLASVLIQAIGCQPPSCTENCNNNPSAPLLLSVSDDTIRAGDTVTITGTDLDGATLSINGNASISILASSSQHVTFEAPANSDGQYTLLVQTPYGSDEITLIYEWTYTPSEFASGIEAFVQAYAERHGLSESIYKTVIDDAHEVVALASFPADFTRFESTTLWNPLYNENTTDLSIGGIEVLPHDVNGDVHSISINFQVPGSDCEDVVLELLEDDWLSSDIPANAQPHPSIVVQGQLVNSVDATGPAFLRELCDQSPFNTPIELESRIVFSQDEAIEFLYELGLVKSLVEELAAEGLAEGENGAGYSLVTPQDLVVHPNFPSSWMAHPDQQYSDLRGSFFSTHNSMLHSNQSDFTIEVVVPNERCEYIVSNAVQFFDQVELNGYVFTQEAIRAVTLRQACEATNPFDVVFNHADAIMFRVLVPWSPSNISNTKT